MSFGFRKMPVLRACFGVALALATVLRCNADVLPRVESRPVLDGVLDDACWAEALTLTNLTRPKSLAAPSQAVTVKVCSNARFLYVAAECAEADTNRIVALRPEEDDNIWQDDSVEVWLLDPTDNARFDHFISSAIGVRETHLKPLPNGSRIRPQWKNASRIVPGGWVTEMAIPFTDLGREDAPVPGEVFQFKFGREDYDTESEGVENAVWPPGAAYGARGNFGMLHVQREGYVQNPELLVSTNGTVPHWELSDIPGFLQSAVEDGVPVAVFSTPGYYAYCEQRLQLPRNRMFSVTCETSGTSGGYLRSRTGLDTSRSVTVELQPSEEWVTHELLFITDDSGRATIIFGTTEDNEPGVMKVRKLVMREEMLRDYLGEPVRLNPRDNDEAVIRALRVADSRVLRGFCATPVDGTMESWDWAMRPWEYNMPGSGVGIKYDYLDNDGLHVTLEDAEGVNAIQVRGGIRANVVADATRYDDAASGTPVHVFEGRARNSLAYFRKPVKAGKFSFFNVRDGVIADMSFLRMEERAPKVERVQRYAVTGGGPTPAIWNSLEARFGKSARTTYALVPVATDDEALTATGRVTEVVLRTPVHLVAAAATNELPVSAVALRGRWTRTPGTALVTVQVQDPVHPFAALATATVSLESRGELNLVLDFPDQVLQPGQCLWVTLTPRYSLTVEDLRVAVYVPTRAEAVAQALPYQLFRAKAFFQPMSENRPWTQLRYKEDLRRSWREQYAKIWPGLEPLFNAVETARVLDPADPLAEQYERWLFRSARERAGLPVLRPVVLVSEAGAPEWATLARAAWLQTRWVADWWLQNRVVPTGEFGTEVNDDSDLWQNFANFPMLERDGVGGALVEYGQRFLDLAVDGGYLEAGVNANQDDPLHAYEEGINHEAMMLWWKYGDPVIVEQNMVASRSTEAFTTINAAGHRHFKTELVSSADLRNQRPDQIDGYNHGLLMHPVVEVAWYNRNPRALKFLQEYCDAWLAHMQKPDEYATLIETATDKVLESSFEPFRESMSFQMSVMMTAADTLNDPRYVQPAVNFVRAQSHPDYLRTYLLDLYEGGYLGNIDPLRAYLYRFAPQIEWRETGNKEIAMHELRRELAEIQSFPDMYTTIEPYTDRVFLEPKRGLVSSSLAYTGGYATRNRSRHSHAISWDGFGTNYAALVRTSTRDAFRMIAYNFGSRPLRGSVRFWRLDYGEYLCASGIDEDGDDAVDRDMTASTLEIARGEPVPLTLAPRAVTVLRLSKLRDLGRLEDRADLALSPSEVAVVGENVRGLAHNIGSSNVADVIVALVDAKGAVRSTASLGMLEAPLDLAPRRKPFNLQGLPESHAGWQVVLDPERVVAEIYEANNAVELP